MELFHEDHVRLEYEVENDGPMGPCVFIHHASVDPDFRRQGRYRKALNSLQELLQMPIVLESYHSLVGMYEKLGFRDEGLCHPDGYHEMVRPYMNNKISEDMETDLRILNRKGVQALGEKSLDDFIFTMDFTNGEHIETSVCGYGEGGELVHVYNSCYDSDMNLHYLHELQLLEPGKDPVCLVSYFTDEMGDRVGPALYRYPDGSFAAMEHYDPREADFSVLNPMKSKWFSPNGDNIDSHEFDFNFLDSIKGVGIKDLLFLPHFTEIDLLSKEFYVALRSRHDDSVLICFREGISSWPDSKLALLEEVIRDDFASEFSAEIIEPALEKYVHGYIHDRNSQSLQDYVTDKIQRYFKSHVVDPGSREVLELPSQNIRIDTYGEFSYSVRGCYEVSDTFKYVESFKNGVKEGAHFLTSTSYGDFRIGPDVSYYPDGRIACLYEHGYAGLETDVIYERHFNLEGRLCHPSETRKEFKRQWQDVGPDISCRRGLQEGGKTVREAYKNDISDKQKVNNKGLKR